MPAAVAEVAAGGAVHPVWENELGNLTFQLGTGAERRFVKWTPTGSGIHLAKEVARLRWAVAFTPVPRVLEHGADDDGAWIVTAGLPGESAVSERWKADPTTAVAALGAGLRAFHDALPVQRCPFIWSVQCRLAEIHRRPLEPARWEPEHRTLGVRGALDHLADAPPVDEVVVCQGDACAPNTLLTDDGRWSGHVDLGALGVADRWADLAIATWSTNWNYGPGWEDPLLAAHGVDRDPDRIAYYRMLWDLGPCELPRPVARFDSAG